MSQEFILGKSGKNLSFNGGVRPQIPANLEHIGEIKAIGVASAPGPFWLLSPYGGVGYCFGVASLLNKLNVWNDLAAGELHQVEFKDAHKDAGPDLNFKINAMERKDQTIDIAIETYIKYTTAYGDQKKLNRWDPTASLFQDEVGFTIRPKNEKLVEINSKGVTPRTSLKEAEYSTEVTWGVEGGFNVGINASDGPGGGGDLKVSFSTSISSSTNMKDFEMIKDSDLGLNKITWVSKMKNAYTNKGAKPEAYDSNNMYDLVVDNNTTRWVKEPADAAKSDIHLTYLATFSSIDPDLKNKQVEFEFTTVQRLMHVEILHRWGLPAARVGGVAVAIPYYIRTTGTIVLDLANRTVALKDKESKGLNLKQLAEQNKKAKKAIVYQHGHFQGHSQELTPGSYNINDLGIPNDSLSSLKVEKGLRVTLYEHGNFQGSTKTFTEDTAWVGEDFNDIASSIKVELV